MTRIRTLEFLPEIFQTPTNSQFLGATLDQLVNPPVTRKIDGFIGSKFGYGIDALDYYVTEPTKPRKDYQLEPGVIFLKDNESVAKDFISYPGLLDALKIQAGIVNNNDRLFTSQFYSWDSFTNLDMIINFNQYYWLPEGPPAVTVSTTNPPVYLENSYVVTDEPNFYNIKSLGAATGSNNPSITLLRGGTYSFIVDQDSEFWIQGAPGVSGYSPTQTNLYTRDIYGVTNNGARLGAIVFHVPLKDAQNEFEYPGNNSVDVVSTIPYSEINGATASAITSIDGVNIESLDNKTVMFYNTSTDPTPSQNSFFYTISLSDDIIPVISLINPVAIPTDQKITPINGVEFVNIPFVKLSTSGNIEPIPYISAPLDTLYYQDGTNPNKVGVIKLIENNELNTLNVETEILGKKTFTSENKVVFTNGLKVTFDGDVLPRSYLTGEYYVQGVGTGIQLIPTSELLVPEAYTDATTIPYDTLPFDIGNYDSNLYVPLNPDYIVMARDANNRNPWSRSNRWFHIQVIQATANYLNDPEILTTYGSVENKAKRPIIEFYPNLKLWESGTIAKDFIDFFDTRTTDAFEYVAGQAAYYPDVSSYSTYTGTILKNPTLETGFYIPGQQYKIVRLDTTTIDTWQSLGATLTYEGSFIPGIEYIITDIGTTSQEAWNTIAGTTGVTYSVGDFFVAKNKGTLSGSTSGNALTVLFTAQGSGNYNSSELLPSEEYFISTYGSTNWEILGSVDTPVSTPGIGYTSVSSIVTGKVYVIVDLGTTTQAEWNTIAGTTNVSYSVGSRFKCASTGAGTGQVGTEFYIKNLGNVTQRRWNDFAGTSGLTYAIGDSIVPVAPLSDVFTALLTPRQFTTNSISSGLPYRQIGTGSAYQGFGLSEAQTVTKLIIDKDQITGNLVAGMYINDLILNAPSQLPANTRIYDITGTTTLEITAFWPLPTQIAGTVGDASFVASTKNNADLSIFSGSRIVFAADNNAEVRNKIYIANFSTINSHPVITLTEAPNGEVFENDQLVVTRGENNQGNSYYFDGTNYKLAQSKPGINIQPKFDVFDKNGISFGNENFYESTSFIGCELFNYKRGIGVNDSILGFPLSYSSINNVGDISFEVSLNTDVFNYVDSINLNEPITESVNTGFVHNYIDRTNYTLLTGWQTAVAPSTQYQIFEFTYTPNIPEVVLDSGETITYTVTCDVATLSREETIWPNLQVYNNNSLLVEGTDYTVVYGANETKVSVYLTVDKKTSIQVLVLSDQVSNNAYYSIPINLSNNPFNADITSADIGDIRGHYQSIFYNNPDAQGEVFGSNNTRDLGNLVPYGTRIIQNSASLALPGAFLRTGNHSLFDALEYNSREYIKFKTLLIDTVNKTSFEQRFDPAYLLDEALDQISSVKNQDMPFFWSDMLPNKAAYLINFYTVQNTVLESSYPLSKVYNFSSANYDGVLVYLETTVNNIKIVKQLYRNIDYTVSLDSPTVIVTTNLVKGDKVIVKEYNQTYGSYVPNTPTKLGLYPLSIPKVVLDNSYFEPTYFIVGHDGSYNKLYGEYLPEENLLVDYRDQALLEFETRIYNNIKLSNEIPIQDVDVVPGYFRDTKFSYTEWLQMYSPQFLNWVGQNRIDYKTQLYLTNDVWTYNYKGSTNTLDRSIISQGNWRGFYQYYYDTTTPDQTPWEMIGYKDKPNWWQDRYGPAPYTSDNLILWTDLQDGIDYNNGDPVVLEQYKRPGLLDIIPVDSQGELLNPFETIVGNYNTNTLQRDWVIGDNAPAEFSYRRSSTYPFDLMRLYALMQPANFFNLAVDLDNYKYDATLNQFLYNGRSHLVPNQIQVYGNGIAKTSYINWIVDFEKQIGIGATENIEKLLFNLDVRLVHRLAGFSDKTLLKFFVEKGSPESRNASLLIPDESYQVLLYENQPYDKIIYSSVIIQTDPLGYRVYGNSQSIAYFTIQNPILNGNKQKVTVQDQTVEIAIDYRDTSTNVPYGSLFYTRQELAQFLMSYGKYLQNQGMLFDVIESGIEINWQQMVAEFLYWSQVGWQTGSILTLNPAAEILHIDRESRIVQPLTLQQTNFVLNQNLYPISNKDLSIFRDGSKFKVSALNAGDTLSYAQFNLSNIEHGIVFDNTTLFNDTIYNLITGLKQNRIYSRGTKTAEWNGTLFASGFIYNQDNIQEWTGNVKYTKGEIVKYKNKYWTALKIIQPALAFNELDWKETDYNEVQKGLLPNSSTRSYESALYYDSNKANLENDADQLSFSLIGYRPRPYMTSADLTDITQVNVYKNMIKEKGTRNTLNAFKKAQLPQGGIDYDIYENWAILNSEFGGTLNNNFIEFKLNESKLTGNPSIVGLTNGNDIQGAEQLVPLYSLYNYGRPVQNTEVLPTLSEYVPSPLFPDAGYVNVDDVKMSAYFYSNLPAGVDKNGLIVPINRLYVNDYVWIANYLAKWQILTPYSIGQVTQVRANLNGSCTVIFAQPHNLQQFSIFSIINFDDSVNGYYVVDQVINPYQLLITLDLGSNNRVVTGTGIALTFNSQRVSKPSDIQNLPLLNYEFTKNKVWVDENTDGDWAVYRKSINYLYDHEFTKNASARFGSAVNYTPIGDFLISDPPAGQVYRYQYDALTKEYELDPTSIFAQGESFGTSIVNGENIFFISRPTGPAPNARYIIPYVVNQSTVSDNFQYYQALPRRIAAPTGCTNFGQTMAMTDDSNYLFVSDFTTSNLSTKAGNFIIGGEYQITSVGTTNFVAIGASSNTVGVTFTATGTGSGTGTAEQLVRNKVHVYRKNNIELPATSTVERQTYQIVEVGTTDFTEVGAVENKPGIYFTVALGTSLTGTGVVRQCNYELVYTIDGPTSTLDQFGYSISTSYNGDILVVGAPYEDYSGSIANWGRAYIYQRLKQTFESQTHGYDLSFTLSWTPDNTKPVSLFINGTYIQATNYTITGNTLSISLYLTEGDIITISGNEYVLVQTLETEETPRVGVQFGASVDNNKYGNEILVGAPFALSTNNQEGAVYRYTYGSARFGIINGTNDVEVTTNRTLLLNGYAVTIPAGDAELAALTINQSNITNVQALATNNKLSIYLINSELSQINQELIIGVTEQITLAELGLELFTKTQKILCPHVLGPTQFGIEVKFNEYNSFVVSAPVGTRYALTTFDFSDDENLDNDTVFDNNATQFLDSFKNAGAVYMYDYLENYNENLNNIGAYTYAQSCNAQNLDYGQQPYYGTALFFGSNKVVIGTPGYRPTDVDGQVIVYNNDTGIQNWEEFRQSSPIVDINRVQNMQLFSAETNETLINLDYMDPLQGKQLGAIAENIDVISNTDPASYNNTSNTQSGFVWGSAQIGTVWYDTTNVRYINYHQNDNSYNARYWGTLFPGSDVAVYSWIASDVAPINYTGPGTVKDFSLYTVQTVVNSSNQVQPVYYFWVRDTGIIFANKTLADVTIAEYISNPQATGISYLAPILPDAYALYNSQSYINANDTVLHIGYSSGTKDDPAHQEYSLIRENFANDFLPGFPNISKGINYPQSLYDRMLDSLSGTDETGAVVPDPFLPKAVQSGVLARPRQSFFYNRFLALQNYLQYVNTVLALYPITELRRPTDLNRSGTYYDVTNFWEYVNWWAVGYDNNTKSVFQVPVYADLSTLNVPVETIVTVTQNSQGLNETYRYDGSGVWTRIGLQNGTIRFKDELYDYNVGKFGFGGDFFSTTPFDSYPSEETRWIIRSINEQIFTNDLLIYRNKGLILLFEYIQSEANENQNYLPWLNKTSLVDVSHTIRELVPLQNYNSDNQEFLSGYVNEAKPYHVVIKEFLFDYTGTDIYQGNLTDFDLPASYDSTIDKFVSPELVYANPSNDYEFLPDSPVWQKDEYKEWYNNYGVSLIGQENYLITQLGSYVTFGSDFMIVDNISGFPVNGVIKIADIVDPTRFEYIGYNSIDRALNTLSGLVRGLYETEPFDHLPGENIFIDLPPVVVLDGGKNYTNPPKVLAKIDLSKYPAPREEAILEPIMSLDTVIGINVINPGRGYAVLPEIVIDPSEKYSFDSNKVNLTNNTIEVYAPTLETGDLITYVSGEDNIGGLLNNQNYYVNVLDTTPTSIVALYTTYKDAVSDSNRVRFLSQGAGTQTFELGAKASAISSAYPVRENNIAMRFDRTTYTSRVQDWTPNRFYGANFVGSYEDTQNMASSSLELSSNFPNINTVLASNGGIVFPITNVGNQRILDWSGFERTIDDIVSDTITLNVAVYTDNASGSTIGFTIGMPVCFTGDVGSELETYDVETETGTIYYVAEIVNDTQFKISETQYGPVKSLTSYTPTSTLSCYTAQVIDTAIVSVTYPGIREVTATSSTNNAITVPMTPIGTGGTQGLYTGIPVIFTGSVFGNIEENIVYYVTSVLDNETFTIGLERNPLTLQVSSINAANQLLMESVVGLNVDDKIVFSNMTIDGVEVTNFGNIIPGAIYYVKEIGINLITISDTLGGSEKDLDPVTQSDTTYAFFTSQEDTFDLTDATGSMTMNIQLPVSPGQVDGQQFSFYPTSKQYANITPTIYGNLVQRTVEQVLAASNTLALNGNATNLYEGFPFTVDTAAGGLATDKTYYISNISNIEILCDSTSNSTCTITGTFLGTTMTVTSKSGSGSIYEGAVISGTGIEDTLYVVEQLSGVKGETGTYRVNLVFPILEYFTDLTSDVGLLSLATDYTTDKIYIGMPVVFSGTGISNIIINQTYYVRDIIDNKTFVVSLTSDGYSPTLSDSIGSMFGAGSLIITPYLPADELVFGQNYYIRTLGDTDWESVGATLAINNVTGFISGQTYIINKLSATDWNEIAGTEDDPISYKVGDIFVSAITGSDGTPTDGEAYLLEFTATGAGTGTGTADVVVTNYGTQFNLNQKIVADPLLDVSYILGGYRVIINNGGLGFTVNNTITIEGSSLGGISPDNDLTLTVDTINSIEPGQYSWSLPLQSDGSITKFIVSGTPNGTVRNYYLKVIDATSFEVYSDPRMTEPVSGIDFAYQGYTETNATYVGYVDPFPGSPYTDITLVDASDFVVNQAVTFTKLDNASYTISEGSTYYIVAIAGNIIRVSDEPGGDPIAIADTSIGTTNILVTAAGSFMLLPEPFYFDPDIVMFNNRVWMCMISNNDSEFVFGKWEELNSGNRRLNAMDRVKGYYQPTINMPGKELDQLFTGVTYPNTTYKANVFDPNSEFPIDTILQDQPFYPTNVNIPAIVFQGINYFAPVNLPNYSGFIADIEVTDDWLLAKIADKPLALTDLILENNKYVMTSNNVATPIMVSPDSKVWSTNGFFIPYGTSDEDIPYVKTKLIASGLSLNAVAYGNGKYVAVGPNILTTDDLGLWRETYIFNETSPNTGNLYDVTYVDNDFYTGWIAVGERNSEKIILFSTDAEIWDEVSAGSFIGGNNNTLNGVSYNDSTIVVVGDGGVVYTATSMTNWTYVDIPALTNNFNSVAYHTSVYVAVGNNGIIYRSTDGTSWTNVLNPSTENLNAIHYLAEKSTWTIVGDNNTVLQTTNILASPVVWDTTQIFSTPNPAYTIAGDIFQAGYGPEELVPGIVSDQLTMIVTTRAGTNWPATEYAHVGYDVVSVELDANTENEYSFADIVQVPAQISVFKIVNGISTSLYVNLDYAIDWINKIVTLNSNIDSPDMLRIDVYEVGNGDQLVKSNTENEPLVTNSSTGFDEIYLNCNYSGQRITGGGIVQPDTGVVDDIAVQTESTNDTITVTNTSEYVLNGEITFRGDVFGGVTEGASYFVKSINPDRSSITISDTLVSGIAGPVYSLSDATGSMTIVIQTGPGEFYAEPAVFHNGVKLVAGRTNTVIRTRATTNSIVTYSTAGIVAEQKIVFGNNIVGGLIPHQIYYVKQILNSSEFTVSETLGGPVVSLTNGIGTAMFVTEDYAASVAPNGITARIIFSADYDDADYISFSFFSETEPLQYGYTLPETQVITSTGATTYSLTNYLNNSNSNNAIVEINGRRIIPATADPYDLLPYDIGSYDYVDTNYIINTGEDIITFVNTIPSVGDTIAVTTWNDTERQYLSTMAFHSGTQVTAVDYVDNIITSVHKTITIQTTIPHGLSTNDVVKLDGFVGSYQLNDQTFIINVTSATEFEIYEYLPGFTYQNSAPITTVNTYVSGGYVWLANSFVIVTTRAVGTIGTKLYVANADSLVIGTPIIFTEQGVMLGDQTTIPEIIAGTTYYIESVDLVYNTITVSETRGGDIITFTDVEECFVNLTQWEQTNVDRLWVTVNGYRVPSSNLRLNAANELSILTPINVDDEIMITSMMPSATPDELVYLQLVDENNVGTVYRANNNTRTWLTKAVGEYDTTITVRDYNKITNKNVQTNVAETPILGEYIIPLDATKDDIVSITVYNNNPARLGYIEQNYIQYEVSGTGPYVKISAGDYIETGDILTVESLEGKLIYINGEYMRIESIDTVTNVCDVARGVNGSMVQTYIPKYSEVYSLLEDNRMNQINYDSTWNKIPGIYNTEQGDPLQISENAGARFLRVDV